MVCCPPVHLCSSSWQLAAVCRHSPRIGNSLATAPCSTGGSCLLLLLRLCHASAYSHQLKCQQGSLADRGRHDHDNLRHSCIAVSALSSLPVPMQWVVLCNAMVLCDCLKSTLRASKHLFLYHVRCNAQSDLFGHPTRGPSGAPP